MSQTPNDRPFGAPSGDMWNDVPLFREIQRVLSSSRGPVNWEFARQVGIASASWGTEDQAPTDDDRRGFEEAVRVAELQVAGFTGLQPPSDVAGVEAVRRGQWVAANIEGLRTLLEPAAAKVAEAITAAQREAMPEQAQAGVAQLLDQLSPLLLGAQVGTVLGTLAQQVLGQYDVAVPRPGGAGALLFVVPNIEAFERDWSLDRTEFRTWIAIHEVTHRFEFAQPWAQPRFRELIDDFLSTLTLDVDELQQRIGAFDPSNPEGMQELLAGQENLFGPVLDDEQRLKLARIQAFMTAAEGYGDHVLHPLGTKLLTSYPHTDAAVRRHRHD